MLAMCLISCSKSKEASSEKTAVRITAEMYDYTSLTFLHDSHVWKSEDKLAIFDASGDNQPSYAIPVTPGGKTSLFVCSIPSDREEVTLVAAYPAEAPVSVKEGKINFTIPSQQDGTITSMQAGICQIRKGAYQGGNVRLAPLYKVLNVTIGRGNRTIKEIKVQATDGSLICGNMTLNTSDMKIKGMSSTITVTPHPQLNCSMTAVSVPVIVADIPTSGYIAEVSTEEGETIIIDNISEGLASPERNLELGVSQALFGSLSQSEASSMVNNGVKYLEVTMNTFWRDQTESECQKRFENTKKIINSTPGLKVWSVHLPFSGSLDISVLNDAKRAENVALQAKMIRMAGEFKPEKLVLHPSSEPISDSDRKARMDKAKESIALLLPVAKEIGAQLCIENLPRTCLGRTSDEMLYIIEDFPEVGVCFDSNHLLIESHNSFFKNVGNRIGTIHASDYDKVDERHWNPGKGVIDWPEFMTNLLHYGYNGVFMTEVKSETIQNVIKSYDEVVCKTN